MLAVMLPLSDGFGTADPWTDRLDRIRFHDSIDRQNDGHATAPQLPYRNVRKILKRRRLRTPFGQFSEGGWSGNL
jgi:hypothetical protein